MGGLPEESTGTGPPEGPNTDHMITNTVVCTAGDA